MGVGGQGGWQSIKKSRSVPSPWILTKSLLQRLLTWNRSSMTTHRLVKLERMAMHPKNLLQYRRYVGEGDMLLKEICYQRRYVTGGEMLPEKICCRRGYNVKGI